MRLVTFMYFCWSGTPCAMCMTMWVYEHVCLSKDYHGMLDLSRTWETLMREQCCSVWPSWVNARVCQHPHVSRLTTSIWEDAHTAFGIRVCVCVCVCLLVSMCPSEEISMKYMYVSVCAHSSVCICMWACSVHLERWQYNLWHWCVFVFESESFFFL